MPLHPMHAAVTKTPKLTDNIFWFGTSAGMFLLDGLECDKADIHAGPLLCLRSFCWLNVAYDKTSNTNVLLLLSLLALPLLLLQFTASMRVPTVHNKERTSKSINLSIHHFKCPLLILLS